MNNIELNLNNTEKLNIELTLSLDQMHCCDYGFISFQNDNNSIMLYNDSLRPGMSVLEEVLMDVISGNYTLHSSIDKDIGYIWNIYLNSTSKKTSGLIFNNDGFWVGDRHLIWTNSGYDYPITATWLYNNDQGEIILEVTPSYKWHFLDPEPGDEFISYEDFMKSYQPILFRTISKEVAQEWLVQAQAILKQIENNIERDR